MRKLIKGSKAARDYMAKIRSKIKTVKIGAAGDYAKYEIAVIKKLASLLKKPYKIVLETVNLDHSLLDIISKNFDKKVTVLNCAKELKAKLILVAKKNPIQAFVEILSKLPKAQTKEIKPKFPIKLPATVTIGANKKTMHKDTKSHNVRINVISEIDDKLNFNEKVGVIYAHMKIVQNKIINREKLTPYEEKLFLSSIFIIPVTQLLNQLSK